MKIDDEILNDLDFELWDHLKILLNLITELEARKWNPHNQSIVIARILVEQYNQRPKVKDRAIIEFKEK